MSQNQEQRSEDQLPRYAYQKVIDNGGGMLMDAAPGAVVYDLPASTAAGPLHGFNLAENLIEHALRETQPMSTQWSVHEGIHHVSGAATVKRFYGSYKDLAVIVVPNDPEDIAAIAEKYDLAPLSETITALYTATLKSTSGSTPVATKRVYAVGLEGERGDPRTAPDRRRRIVAITESSANAVWQAALGRYQQAGRAALVAALQHPYHGGAFEQGKR